MTVTNFPADQLVHFVEPIAVTGPLTAAELVAAEPLTVTGTFTAEGGATEVTLERVADSLDDVGLTAILEREKIEA